MYYGSPCYDQFKIWCGSLITAIAIMARRALFPLVLFCILALGSLAPGLWPWHASYASTETTNENAISIKSISTRYDAEFETFHVFGELVNNLKTPVEDIVLNVTFYDSEGNLTGSIVSSPFFTTLRPGEKSAFDIVAQGEAAYRLIDFSYYKISRTWERAAESRETLMRLDLRDIANDACGYYRIDGQVTNLAKEHASGIEIAAAFYNSQNQIVGTGFTSIDERLDPTKAGQFSMVVEKEVLPHFAYYSFNVQSDNYTSVVIEEEGENNLSNFHSLVPIRGKIMTVETEQLAYSIDEDKISVRGMVPPEEVKKRDENSLALIKIVSGSGTVPVLVTAPVAQDGTFSRVVEFQMDESMTDQVFRIRAEYFGMMAESTFAVKVPGEPEQVPTCKTEKVSVSELNALSGGATDAVVTDFLSGVQAKLGSEVILSAVVDNEVSRTQNVTVLFEVLDSRGLVVYLHAGEWTLEPNTEQELRVAWVPEEGGTFVVKSFVISTLSHPVLLSTGAPLSVTIEG
jgi:hypothetical protein